MPAPTSPPSSFTLLVLGASGGPCETSCSGYLLKPAAAVWEDGFVSIEGGSGVGAMKVLLEEEEREREIRVLREELSRLGPELQGRPSTRRTTSGIQDIMNDIDWPTGYDTPTLRAGYLFSFLTSYIVTHAHLDHIASMVQSTGTLPSRVVPVNAPARSMDRDHRLRRVDTPQPTRRSIYAAEDVLKEIETAYRGEIWPELAVWARDVADEEGQEGGEGQPGAAEENLLGAAVNGNAKPSSSFSSTPPTVTTPNPIHPSTTSSTLPPPSRSSKPRRKHSFVSLGRKLFRLSAQTRGEDQERSIGADGGRLAKRAEAIEERPSTEGTGGMGSIPEKARNGQAIGAVSEQDPSLKALSRIRPRDPWRIKDGVGVQLCPIPSSGLYQTLPQSPPHHSAAIKHRPQPTISIMHMPVAHGCNSKGTFESSAFFIRLDGSGTLEESTGRDKGMEFLFWGDVESRTGTDVLNRDVWRQAARRWGEGRLGAVFIECSYDGQRVASQMYGHLQPQLLHNELCTMASFVSDTGDSKQEYRPPLQSLRVYIIHVKETFVPDDMGRTVRERVVDELRAIEAVKKGEGTVLGVEFIAAERGMVISI